MAGTRRTAQEKAQEALNKAEGQVTTTSKRVEKAQAELDAAKAAATQATQTRDYAASHPALQGTVTGTDEVDPAAPAAL